MAMNDPLLLHHYDADGIAAAGIVCLARKSAGKSTRTRSVKINGRALDGLEGERELVFVDCGSGMLPAIEALAAECVIIDHHPPSGRALRTVQANPRDYGFDGGSEASAATTAFYCFKYLELPRVAELGIVGAVGDMQDLHGFRGLNEEMASFAAEKGETERIEDLKMFGRSSRSLVEMLEYCTEPFLPDLTGDEKACALFLERNGFRVSRDGRRTRYYGLPPKERRRFASTLTMYCIENAVNKGAIQQMAGQVFLFPNEAEGTELRDAHEFAELLNSCGRLGAPETGLRVCLGDAEALKEAQRLLKDYATQVRESINYAKENGFDAGPYYLVDGKGKISDTVVGVVASAYLTSGIVKRDKPVIALSASGGEVKASGRGTAWLVKKGLDLGETFRKAAQAAGGVGGGHEVAAGATFGEAGEHAFLKKAKEVIEIQLEMR